MVATRATRATRGTKTDDNAAPLQDTSVNMLKAPPKRAGRPKKTVVSVAEEPSEPTPAPKKPTTVKSTKAAANPAPAKATATRGRRAAASKEIIEEHTEPDHVVEEPVEEPKPEPVKVKATRAAPKKPVARAKATTRGAAQKEEVVEEPAPEEQSAPKRRAATKSKATVEVEETKEEPVKAKRGRPATRKQAEVVPEVVEEEVEVPVKPVPARATRGRAAKKTQKGGEDQVDELAPAEPEKTTQQPTEPEPVPEKPKRGRPGAKSQKDEEDVEAEVALEVSKGKLEESTISESAEPVPVKAKRGRPAAKKQKGVVPEVEEVEQEEATEPAPVKATKSRPATKKRKAEDEPVAEEAPEIQEEPTPEPEAPKKAARGRKAAAKALAPEPEKELEKPKRATRAAAPKKAVKENKIEIVTSGAAAAKKEAGKKAVVEAPVEEMSAPKSPEPAKIEIVTSGAAAAKKAAENKAAIAVPVEEPVAPKSPEPSKIPVKSTPATVKATPGVARFTPAPIKPTPAHVNSTPARGTPAKPVNLSIPNVEDPFAPPPSTLKAPPMKIPNFSPSKAAVGEARTFALPAKDASPVKTSSVIQHDSAANPAASLLTVSPRKAPVASPLKQSPVKFRAEPAESHVTVTPARKSSMKSSILQGSARKPQMFAPHGSAVKATPRVHEAKESLLKTCPKKLHFAPSAPKPDSEQAGSSLFGGSMFSSSLLQSTPKKFQSPAKFSARTAAMSPFVSGMLQRPQGSALDFITTRTLSTIPAEDEESFVESVLEQKSEAKEGLTQPATPEEDSDVTMTDAMDFEYDVPRPAEEETAEATTEEAVYEGTAEVAQLVNEYVEEPSEENSATSEPAEPTVKEPVQTQEDGEQQVSEHAVQSTQEEMVRDAAEDAQEENVHVVEEVTQLVNEFAEVVAEKKECAQVVEEVTQLVNEYSAEITKEEERVQVVEEVTQHINEFQEDSTAESTPKAKQLAVSEQKLDTAYLQLEREVESEDITLNLHFALAEPDYSREDVDDESSVTGEVDQEHEEELEDSVVEPGDSTLLEELNTQIELEMSRPTTPIENDDSAVETTPMANQPESTTPASEVAVPTTPPTAEVSYPVLNLDDETIRFGEPDFGGIRDAHQSTPAHRTPRVEVSRPVTPEQQQIFATVAPPFSIRKALSELPVAMASPIKSALRSPDKKLNAKTPKKVVTWVPSPQAQTPVTLLVADGPLTGTVVYCDVFSDDGKAQNDLFEPLLTDLGAQVVNEWKSHNMGLTHVLFKAGDQKTLHKVLESDGAVKCVKVGWAIDCDKYKKRLDETPYLIDLRTPQASPTRTPAKTPARTPARTPSRTPFKFGISFATPLALTGIKSLPGTPFNDSSLSIDSEDKENSAPAPGTPSTNLEFLDAKNLVQKTCPPKQSTKETFALDGGLGSGHTPFKARLMAAKRRSAEFAPRVGSPLKRGRGIESMSFEGVKRARWE
ncbi:hypothetical protein GQ43DRAFT_472089 [Delitschia confertaspora ATCC 74209]|uniref:BRCT domain-containing protein n=1 Tax=Delitschia confertaspora ATCC 74209 TaxID=1513339 RepID=A0A9P4JL02_9PLEO|nr:hypothetical protein GQ43DRAFT_472089 [Delitschia confertaspora ATCC 74209]